MKLKNKPAQSQAEQPGKEHKMVPKPKYNAPWYKGSQKLTDKVVLITGGDSGIGRAVSVLCAREGANIAIVYHDEDTDAKKTKQAVEKEGSKCLLIGGDIKEKEFCYSAVTQTLNTFKRIDILINNAAVQYPENSINDITIDHLDETFKTNIYPHFYFTQASLSQLKKHSGTIINSASVTAYRGSHHLIDYAATKGAIVAFTRSLAKSVASDGIRVNAVAPGPVWTPLIPASFSKEQVESFGDDALLGRAAHPEEIAPSYVFLASRDASYMTGQVLHPNGGEIINT